MKERKERERREKGETIFLERVCSWVDKDVDLEAIWKGAQQLDPDAEPDDGGHRAVGHGGREENADVVFLILHLDEAKVHDLELLERELRVLRVPQGAQKLCVRGQGQRSRLV